MTNRHTLPIALLAASITGLLGTGLYAQDANVAPLGLAEQSSLGSGGTPDRAIDGNTDGVFNNGSVSHTMTGDLEPWWRVDLLDIFSLTRIVIWNRTDCCSERLSDFRVAVLDEDQSELWGGDFFADGTFPAPGEGFEITLPDGTLGAMVQISLYPSDPVTDRWLSLAEVQVFTSDAVELAPTIDVPPRGGVAVLGESFEFSVSASGTAPLDYQWIQNGNDIPGAEASIYRIESVTLENAGAYQVRVSNTAGEVTSNPVSLVIDPGRNLALCGQASQSTTGFEGTPDRAIDGITDGVYGNGSITHTAEGDLAPWWEVKLAETSDIEFIKIWNRLPTDCCAERLTDFLVSVLAEDRGLVWEEVFFEDGLGFPDSTLDGLLIDVGGPIEGRTVRIELQNTDLRDPANLFLSLAEVQVFGTSNSSCEPPAHPSLAHREEATATQSSVSGQFGPVLAQDDNFATFTHTLAGDLAPTWQVDLGGVFPIEEIDIVNRTQCCVSRLRDITVSILDATGETVLFQSELLNPENELGGGTLEGSPPRLTLPFDPPVEGQIVRVERTPDPDLSGTGNEGTDDDRDVLSLAEVFVYPPTDCPQGDTHCVGVEPMDEPAGGGPGTYTFEVESRDDSGDIVTHVVSIRDLDDPGAPGTIFRTSNSLIAVTLGFGNWEITVDAVDGTRCDVPAIDSRCTIGIDIERDPCLLSQREEVVATQSTTHPNGQAEHAIDGNTDGVFTNGSQTHTAADDPAPWWELDLGDELDIGSIVLWNRSPADCPCADRLTNFRVSVLTSDRDVVWEDVFFEDPDSFPDTTLEGFPIDVVGAGITGQIVRIEFVDPELRDPTTLFLTLAEVQVFCTDVEPQGVGPFVRGDCDQDGVRNLTDGIFLLNFLFLGGPLPKCDAACDVNADGDLNITTAVFLFNFLFLGGPQPVAPSPTCARSQLETDVERGCVNPTGCM